MEKHFESLEVNGETYPFEFYDGNRLRVLESRGDSPGELFTIHDSNFESAKAKAIQELKSLSQTL
jgi:hypothetical protein